MLRSLPQKNPHSSIASGCVPGAPRVVLYKFEQIDMVCTLVQAIYFEVGTYEYDHTQYAFLSTTYFIAWSGGVPYIFDTRNKGKNNRPSCCEAAPREGRGKRRQYPRKKPVSGMHSSRIASYAFGVFFPQERLVGGWRALLLLWSLTPLL